MNRKDFSYQYGQVWEQLHNYTDGYRIFYKGKFVTGAGTGKHYCMTKKALEFWKEQAESTIQSIISNPKHYKLA